MPNTTTATVVPKVTVPVPGFAGLTLTVFGHIKAEGLAQAMAQGFYVAQDGKALSRAELPPKSRAAAEQLLISAYPEHAAIAGLGASSASVQ